MKSSKKPIMIMGCSSDAGKSFLVTALCRHFANAGLRVAPFKAQNMSNNAAVTSEGFEMGRAQYLQALAARTSPQARMNPILLKPSADTYSQVIVLGKHDKEISDTAWQNRKEKLWPIVKESLHGLIDDFDKIIIEGAGSPAEINLRDGDIVNMSVALECKADVYLTADINKGGAFAHLLGTWMCLSAQEQALVKGFILNKFRGDLNLLGDASKWLQNKTGIPTVGIIPMIPHKLPEEDSFFHKAKTNADDIKIALIIYPYASNLDEFDPLIYTEGVSVIPIKDYTDLDNFDAIILPGSKNTVQSLKHLIKTGLDSSIFKAAKNGKQIYGVCGGMQILGNEILDPHFIEGESSKAFGLLDIHTTLLTQKITTRRIITWQGKDLSGYEIHNGQSFAGPNANIYFENNLGFNQKNIFGTYLHGLFENSSYLEWFLSSLGWKGSVSCWSEIIHNEIEKVSEQVNAQHWLQDDKK